MLSLNDVKKGKLLVLNCKVVRLIYGCPKGLLVFTRVIVRLLSGLTVIMFLSVLFNFGLGCLLRLLRGVVILKGPGIYKIDLYKKLYKCNEDYFN